MTTKIILEKLNLGTLSTSEAPARIEVRVGQTLGVTLGVSAFVGLSDTPFNYVGQARKYPVVNVAEAGLEFKSLSEDFEFAAHNARIAAVESDVADHETRITTNTTNIADHETRITTNTTNIASNDAELADHETRITTNTTNIADHETRITTNTTDIADHETRITTNTADIASNDAELADHETRITTNTSNIVSLTDQAILMTEAQSTAIRNQNKEYFNASGMVHAGKHGTDSINEGMYTDLTTPNVIRIGGGANGTSKTDLAVNHIAGAVSKYLKDIGVHLPEAPDGTVTYNTVTGVQTQHVDASTAFAYAGATADEEVVTERVDMYGLEQYLEVVTDARKEVFPTCIQNESTTFGDTDVPTVLSTRPLSYFQVYDGQFPDPSLQNDRYRCVVWDDLTYEQKAKVANYLGAKLFYNGVGQMVNTHIRQRTIAGAGNGDWGQILSAYYGIDLGYANKLGAHPYVQGILDMPKSPAWNATFVGGAHINNKKPEQGVFTANVQTSNDVAYQGECYFYVMGAVPRLNQGAYHPSFNAMGAAGFVPVANPSWLLDWFSSVIGFPVTTARCFLPVNFPTSGGGTYGGFIGAAPASRRPDGRFYDAIYASGQGGVIDLRLSCQPSMDSAEESAKVEAKVENGSYRGMEKLVWSQAYTRADIFATWNTTNSIRLHLSGVYNTNGRYMSVTTSTGIDTYTINNTYASGSELVVFFLENTVNADFADATHFVIGYETNISVSGNFTTQDVIGDPANILKTAALKDGWLGRWIPQIPPVVGVNTIALTRKCIQSENILNRYTLNNGATWTSASIPYNSATNGSGAIADAAEVRVYNYTAFTYQTKPSTNKPVLNGKQGVGDVLVTNSYGVKKGVLLNESVTGKIGTKTDYRSYKVLDYVMIDGKLTEYDTSMTTLPVDASEIGSWQISNNGQCSMMYNSGSIYHELALGYAWTKNMARAGTQVKGVDVRSVRFKAMPSYYNAIS